MPERFQPQNGNYIQQELDRARVRMTDFADVYSPKELSALTSEVDRLEDSFGEKLDQDTGEKMEYIMYQRIEQGDWFGDFTPPEAEDPEAEAPILTSYVASKYDDLFNRTDVILAMNNQYMQGQLFSLDVTSARSPQVIEKKMRPARYAKHLPPGFENINFAPTEEEADIRGPVHGVPHFVIGADPRLIDELAKLVGPHRYLTDADRSRRDYLEARLAAIVTTEIRVQADVTLAGINDDIADYFRQAERKAHAHYREYSGGRPIEDLVENYIVKYADIALRRVA